MIGRALGFVLMAMACSTRSGPVFADRERRANARLTGAWDLTLTLDQPYPLGFSSPPARRVCGTIGFVDAVATSSGDVDRESDGVYHVALAQLGLDWLNDTKFPSAIARQGAHTDGGSAPNDSVSITLNPESQEHIQLLGVYRAAQIAGNWSAQSARGTATGVFTLRPHTPGSSQRC